MPDRPPAHKRIRAGLELEPGEPLRGSLTPEDGGPLQPFSGWIELANALEALRRPAEARSTEGGP